MLKQKQIEGDLLFSKLGKDTVTINTQSDDWFSVYVKDSRFFMIKELLKDIEYKYYWDCGEDLEGIYHIENTFQKYIAKAMAKQGVSQKDGLKISIGKTSKTYEFEDPEYIGDFDDNYYETIFNHSNPNIECSYTLYVKGDNDWVISRFLEDVFDKEQFVNDYFLYTDELISDLNKCLTTMIKGYHKMLVEDWHYVAPIGESVWDIWTDKAIEMNNLLDRYKKAETA